MPTGDTTRFSEQPRGHPLGIERGRGGEVNWSGLSSDERTRQVIPLSVEQHPGTVVRSRASRQALPLQLGFGDQEATGLEFPR